MSFDDSNIVPFGQISSAKNTVGHGGDATVEEILDFAGNCLENALVIGEDTDGHVHVMTCDTDFASLFYYLELARQTFVGEITSKPVL